MPEAGSKTKSSAEENKALKNKIGQLMDEIDATKKGMIHTSDGYTGK